jgi:hypothetical protein
MNELAVVDKGADWHRLKALVLYSVSSPITKRVYNLGLDEFFAWYGQEPRPGFTKATVAALAGRGRPFPPTSGSWRWAWRQPTTESLTRETRRTAAHR